MKHASLRLGRSAKRTRKREFLESMDRVVPWTDLVELITPCAPEAGRRGRQPFPVEAMLRVHFMQQWFTLSDPAMEEALHDTPLLREFAGLGGWGERLTDESAILRFRHLLETHKLADKILQTTRLGQLVDQIERLKADIRAKVEHPFRVIKRQFVHAMVRYRGLKKNTAQLTTLFAPSNLWVVREKLAVLDGIIRPMTAKVA